MTEQEYIAFNNFIHELLYEKMTLDDYDFIMSRLGTTNKNGRFRSICHHSNPNDGGYNLAFMSESRFFYCHSGCQCSYSLLSLIKKHRSLVGQTDSTYQALKWLCEELNVEFNFKEKIEINTNIYKWQNSLIKYTNNGKGNKELVVYDKDILRYFPKLYHTDWIDYGISEEVLDKYNIRWYNYKSQIVIPCYRNNGDLIGIRIRNMAEGVSPKYMPLELLNGKQYKFPTNMVFYGENFNMPNVERTKSVILVEAEKTVLKYETWYGAENNICLALYGSNLGKEQLKKLIKAGVDTFYIALDSDFHEVGDNNEYNDFEKKVFKIYDLIKPYSNNVYVLYNNLGYENCYKYSITDYTKEQFEQLWNSKERILE